jgi:hypothetical protein
MFQRIEVLCTSSGHVVVSDRHKHSKQRSLSIDILVGGCAFVLAAQTVHKIRTIADTLTGAEVLGADAW